MKPAILIILMLSAAMAAQGTLTDSVDNIGEDTRAALSEEVEQQLTSATTAQMDVTRELLSSGARIDAAGNSEMAGLRDVLTAVVLSMLVLGFVYAGGKLVKSGSDPVEREKAKGMIQNMVMIIILVYASGVIYDFVMQLEADFVGNLLEVSALSNEADFATTLSYGEYNMFGTAAYYLALLAAGVTLFARQAIIATSGILLPLIIGLYFAPIDGMHRVGEIYARLIGIAVFVPLLDTAIIKIIELAPTLTGVPTLAFAFMALANVGICFYGATMPVPQIRIKAIGEGN